MRCPMPTASGHLSQTAHSCICVTRRSARLYKVLARCTSDSAAIYFHFCPREAAALDTRGISRRPRIRSEWTFPRSIERNVRAVEMTTQQKIQKVQLANGCNRLKSRITQVREHPISSRNSNNLSSVESLKKPRGPTPVSSTR